MFSRQLSCPQCGWRSLLDLAAAIGRLRLVGVLRREQEPDPALVAALLDENAAVMTCPTCRNRGLVVADGDSHEGDDWQAAVLCEGCRQPIDPERLEFLPGTLRCANCQVKAERGQPLADEIEYCPRCGSVLELRVSRAAGITRYQQFCTGGCRRRG